MGKAFYFTQAGRLRRKQNTLYWEPREGPPRTLPVETISELYWLAPIRLGTPLLRFLGEKRIPAHVFSPYGHYRGSFLPKAYLLSGEVRLRQAAHVLHRKKRLELARRLVRGTLWLMQRNLAYYANRGRPTTPFYEELNQRLQEVETAPSLPALMGIEGAAKRTYYAAFGAILEGWDWPGRSKRPPTDPVNALISFLNSLTYAVVLGQLYHTPLEPTIGFLHAPRRARYTLALDLAEVFKPVLADRLLFRLLNRRELSPADFEPALKGLVLKPTALRTVLKVWEERLSETLQHRSLRRPVSYRYLIRLEAYKLLKHFLGIQPYEPLKPWW